MAKKFGVLLLTCLLLVALVGCGGDKVQDPEKIQDLTQEQYLENAQKVADLTIAYLKESKADNITDALKEFHEKSAKELKKYPCATDVVEAYGMGVLKRENIKKEDLKSIPKEKQKAFGEEMKKNIPNALAIAGKEEAVADYEFKGMHIIFFKNGTYRFFR